MLSARPFVALVSFLLITAPKQSAPWMVSALKSSRCVLAVNTQTCSCWRGEDICTQEIETSYKALLLINCLVTLRFPTTRHVSDEKYKLCNPYFHRFADGRADGQKRLVVIRSAAVIHSPGLQFLQFAWVCTTQISDNITIYIFRGMLSQEHIDLYCIRLLRSWGKPKGEFYFFPADIWKTGLHIFTPSPV